MTGHTDYVRRLLDETRDEVTRADTKASIVLAAAGIVVGILLTGFVTGDVSLAGQRWYVGLFAWVAATGLIGGVGVVGCAVYPRIGKPEKGRARWFAEIQQYGEDEEALSQTVEADRDDRTRDLHQTRVLAGIVGRKYLLTKVGMWLLGVGFAAAALAALLSLS